MFLALSDDPTANLKQLSTTRAEEAAYSRFLNNDATHLDSLIYGVVQESYGRLRVSPTQHLLIVNDTSEINLQAHIGYHGRRELGVAGNNTDAGFFLHASIALDALTGQPRGCAAIELWTRKGGSADRTEEESQKWFEVQAQLNQARLPQMLTFVQDREGDIFSLWQQMQGTRHHLLTRARQDRRIALTEHCPTGKLWADLARQPVGGQYSLKIKRDAKKERLARTSVMEARWVSVELLEPRMTRAAAQRVRLQAIEVRECTASVPEGQTPLVWRLLTTHTVNSLKDALQIVRWYLDRWRVEDIFACLKTRGLDLEQTRLHSGQAIMKLCVMSLWSAARLTALVQGREDEITDARVFFPEVELGCMDSLCSALEGDTAHQRNRYATRSVAWAVWILARLGRWHGSGQPGIETIRAGLHTFEAVFLGWNIAKQI